MIIYPFAACVLLQRRISTFIYLLQTTHPLGKWIETELFELELWCLLCQFNKPKLTTLNSSCFIRFLCVSGSSHLLAATHINKHSTCFLAHTHKVCTAIDHRECDSARQPQSRFQNLCSHTWQQTGTEAISSPLYTEKRQTLSNSLIPY